MSTHMPIVQREPWMKHGACIGLDPDLFFPERGQSLKFARTVCAACPVRTSCLEYAFRTHQRWGVWGGLSERERKILRKNQRQQGAVA